MAKAPSLKVGRALWLLIYYSDIIRLPRPPIFTKPVFSSEEPTFMIPVSFSFSKAVKSIPVIKALAKNEDNDENSDDDDAEVDANANDERHE